MELVFLREETAIPQQYQNNKYESLSVLEDSMKRGNDYGENRYVNCI